MFALNALADPTRQRIVEMLAVRELSAGAIADSFDVTAPAISQHLKVLKDAKLVRVRVDAQRRIYALDQSGFDEVGVRVFPGTLTLDDPCIDDELTLPVIGAPYSAFCDSTYLAGIHSSECDATPTTGRRQVSLPCFLLPTQRAVLSRTWWRFLPR